jgi:hypothetical protein
MLDPVGDWARLSCFMDSWSDSSAKPTEERGEASREAMLRFFDLNFFDLNAPDGSIVIAASMSRVKRLLSPRAIDIT